MRNLTVSRAGNALARYLLLASALSVPASSSLAASELKVREAASAYPQTYHVEGGTIGVDYLSRSLPTPQGTQMIPGIVIVEVGVYPSPELVAAHAGQLQLGLEGGRVAPSPTLGSDSATRSGERSDSELGAGRSGRSVAAGRGPAGEVGRGRHRYARLPLVVAAQDGREKDPLAMARAPSRTGKPPPDCSPRRAAPQRCLEIARNKNVEEIKSQKHRNRKF